MSEAVQHDPQSADELFEEVRERAQSFANEHAETSFDYESAEGNKAARSHVHAARKLKGDIERARKAAKEDIVRRGREIDSTAKAITAPVQAEIDRHQGPLEEIEQREVRRVEAHREQIAHMRSLASTEGKDLDQLCASLTELRGTNVTRDGFEEFYDEAVSIIEPGCHALNDAIAAERQRIAEREELERLRVEKEERDRAEQARIAREAEEKAAAEQRAREETEARERAEREAAEAKERAARAEREADERAEKARQEERARIEQEQREAEEQRQREQAEAEAEERKRAEDQRNRIRVEREVCTALAKHADLDEDTAARVFGAIEDGAIPHINLTF